MTEKNAELIKGLRELLAFVEANDDFEFSPSSGSFMIEANARTWYTSGEEKQRIFIADLTRRMAHHGKVEKLYSDDYAWIRLHFGPYVEFSISTMRKVICERVVVGKKVIPARPETVIPASPERTEEEIEWRCHPVMTAGTAGTSHSIAGELVELESGTDPATLQLESGAEAADREADRESMPF
jgi:hypothetical protein